MKNRTMCYRLERVQARANKKTSFAIYIISMPKHKRKVQDKISTFHHINCNMKLTSTL